MTTGSPAFAGDDGERDDHPALTPVLRWIADLLCLWALCGKSACRRARACCGEPRHCLVHYAPLTPQDAREGVKAMLAAKHDGLDWHDLDERAPDATAAVADWMALVERAAARPADAERARAI